jgi:hypothetical protein
MFHVRDKRINAAGNAVFDLYRRTPRGFDNHLATIEVRGDAPGGLKVLLGALMPAGKVRAWEAIRTYEGITTS